MDQYEPVVCIKCNQPAFADDSSFCTNCSYELNSNYCTNDECKRTTNDLSPLPEDCCYCDLCGHKTAYFEEGLIEPFEVSSHS